jgi:hypothetical protein
VRVLAHKGEAREREQRLSQKYGWWEPASEDDLYCPACGIEGET